MIRRMPLTGRRPTGWIGLLTAVVAGACLAAGCGEEPEPQALPRSGDDEPPEPPRIIALRPLDRAQEASLRPMFRWQLPSEVAVPTSVSFTLTEMSGGPDSSEAEAEEKPIARASGLHNASPRELDPWNPPPGVIVTGAMRQTEGLKPETWYRWTVRAISAHDQATGQFVFRTRRLPHRRQAHPQTSRGRMPIRQSVREISGIEHRFTEPEVGGSSPSARARKTSGFGPRGLQGSGVFSG